MENQVVKFISRESNKIRANRKENHGLHREYAVIDLDNGTSPIVLRIYWPANVAYACIWINRGETHARGAGRASGGGYCKESAAAQYAISDAGIELENAIDGVGLSAIRDALSAIAKHLDIARFTIHESHA